MFHAQTYLLSADTLMYIKTRQEADETRAQRKHLILYHFYLCTLFFNIYNFSYPPFPNAFTIEMQQSVYNRRFLYSIFRCDININACSSFYKNVSCILVFLLTASDLFSFDWA